MFDRGTIETAGSGLVGWKTSTHANYTTISSLLKSPTSGLYVNSLPGISVDLAEKAAKETSLKTYLDNIHNEELTQLVNVFVQSAKVNLNSKELLSNVTLIQKPNPYDSLISKDGRFVGYVITPLQSKSIKASITDIGFELNATDSFTVYFFESSQNAAVQSFTYTHATADSLCWQDTSSEGLDIEFETSDKGTGTRYLIGYFENDLTASAYQVDYGGEGANQIKRVFGKYMGVAPIYLSSAKLNGTNIPDRNALGGSVSCKAPGFNLKINVKCDITDVLVENIQMFARPLQHAVAIRILSDALTSTDLSPTLASGQNRDMWDKYLTKYRGELYGGHASAGGYPVRVNGMMESLTIDFSELDVVCLKKKEMFSVGCL